MAQYKVPQDVEADDKLIGPFSFRQFIYLIIVSLAILFAWFLGQLFLPLAIIPLPVILLFSTLALPLKKDQPMEIYMAALLSYFLKPHIRIWDPDGIDSLIEIAAPKTIEVQRTKDLSQDEAERRFGYLAQIVDTRGWAVRGVNDQTQSNNSIANEVVNEAQQTKDVLDDDSTTAQLIDQKLEKSTANIRQDMINLLQKPTVKARDDEPTVNFNPYPENIHQSVIEPISESKSKGKQSINTSKKELSADIINLASNTDLSVAAIAREANRINQTKEVIIALR